MTKEDPAPRRNLYGRHSGRPLRPAQAAALDRVMTTHQFVAQDLPKLQRQFEQTWLEIGFGAGEHLAWQAKTHPNALILGAEYYLNGFARGCKHVEDEALSNVRLHHGDARDLMDACPEQSLHRAFILHPDPWPKARQWRRRIVSTETLDRLAVLMVPGSILRIASDHADYQPWIMRVVQDHADFVWTATSHRDWTLRQADWPQTRYEAKSIKEGRPTMYIEAKRR